MTGSYTPDCLEAAISDQEQPAPANTPHITDGVTRREFCLKGAAVVGAAAVTLYVPPVLTPVALPAAFAKAAPANKESCEKDPNEKQPEGCDKCADDKDPSEKSEDTPGPSKDANYDKCLAECKDPNDDKNPNEKDTDGSTSLRPEFPYLRSGLKDEWGPA